MPAIRPVFWATEIGLNSSKMSGGYVRFSIDPRATRVVDKIVPAIEDHPRGLVQVTVKFAWSNQHTVHKTEWAGAALSSLRRERQLALDGVQQ
jgi:hypothetical protein